MSNFINENGAKLINEISMFINNENAGMVSNSERAELTDNIIGFINSIRDKSISPTASALEVLADNISFMSLSDVKGAIEAIIQDAERSDSLSDINDTSIKPETPSFGLKNGDTIPLYISVSRSLSAEERNKIQNEVGQYLFKNGARYTKYVIPAEESRTHKEISGKNWYITYSEGMDLSIFAPYIKDKALKDKLISLSRKDTNTSKSEALNNESHSADKKSLIYLFIPPGPQTIFRETIALFRANGAKFDGSTKKWYITEEQDASKFADFLKPFEEKEDASKIDELEKSYCAKVYVAGSDKPTLYYGSTPDAILSQLQGLNMQLKDSEKNKYCYVGKLNNQTNKYEGSVKYDIETGLDITPRYLVLPSFPHSDNGKNLYEKLIQQLKADGAKFNYHRKQWYVDNSMDLNLFKEYLPINGDVKQEQKDVALYQDNAPKKNYTFEVGKEYYDNRICVKIEGIEPINIYGDDYNVHFPSMVENDIRKLVDTIFPVLPNEVTNVSLEKKSELVEYNGNMYDKSQFNVIKFCIDKDFSEDKIKYVERPDLSSGMLNEIRFGISNGLNKEQMDILVSQPTQWQMSICSAAFSNGLKYDEFKHLLSNLNFDIKDNKQYGERYSALNHLINTHKASVIGRIQDNAALLTKKSDDISDVPIQHESSVAI